jgi:hypothetical protein
MAKQVNVTARVVIRFLAMGEIELSVSVVCFITFSISFYIKQIPL